MNDLGALADELRTIREELESLKNTVRERSLLPTFYKRAIIAVLILSTLVVGLVAVATYMTFTTNLGVQRIYSTLEDWQMIE